MIPFYVLLSDLPFPSRPWVLLLPTVGVGVGVLLGHWREVNAGRPKTQLAQSRACDSKCLNYHGQPGSQSLLDPWETLRAASLPILAFLKPLPTHGVLGGQ